MTAYLFAGYRRGSTNGQKPFAKCFIVGAPDKAAAKAQALRELGAYKVLGSAVSDLGAARRFYTDQLGEVAPRTIEYRA